MSLALSAPSAMPLGLAGETLREEVDEGPHLGGEMARLRIDDVDRRGSAVNPRISSMPPIAGIIKRRWRDYLMVIGTLFAETPKGKP
jgi:hypothetical protein